jgi:hypothetical protein
MTRGSPLHRWVDGVDRWPVPHPQSHGSAPGLTRHACPGDDRLRGAAGSDDCRGGTGTDTASTCEVLRGIR